MSLSILISFFLLLLLIDFLHIANDGIVIWFLTLSPIVTTVIKRQVMRTEKISAHNPFPLHNWWCCCNCSEKSREIFPKWQFLAQCGESCGGGRKLNLLAGILVISAVSLINYHSSFHPSECWDVSAGKFSTTKIFSFHRPEIFFFQWLPELRYLHFLSISVLLSACCCIWWHNQINHRTFNIHPRCLGLFMMLSLELIEK